MKILVTAGNTLVLIDRVRALTNIFTGRTGAAIALEAYGRGHDVTLLTSHPEAVTDLRGKLDLAKSRWRVFAYRTFEDLSGLMEEQVQWGTHAAVIHSAAVSDYLAGGVFAPAPGTKFEDSSWQAENGQAPAMVDRAADKVKSDEAELWLRLVRAPKLVDMVRKDWGFRGTLVKFKLEVGVTDEQLLQIAERSRVQSQADLMVANTLDGAAHWAFVGPLPTGTLRDTELQGGYERVSREGLAARVIKSVEAM